jgi:hypothetical protein
MDPPGAAQTFKLVDPTPGPEDVTSFEQARAKAPAAPAAPAPAPAKAPATPSPAREVKLDKPQDPNRAGNIPESVWDDLDKLATLDRNGTEEKPVAAPEPAKPEEQAKVEPDKAAPEPPDDTAVEADLEKQVQAFKTLKEVRTAHKEALKRERAWKQEQETLAKKIADAEARAKAFDPEAIKATSAELETVKKRAAELESQVKVLDYTKSGEFHERHVRPLAKALESAYADLNEMTVAQEDGTTRKATDADFKRLLSLPAQEAGEQAEKLFGKFAAGELMAHRRTVVQLERAKREAVENASKASEESRQRQTVEQAQKAEKLQGLFKQRTGELEEKFPALFKPRDGDTEGNQLLAKGHQMVQQLEAEDLTDDARVQLAAEIRYRAASYGRLYLDLQRMQKALDEANGKLKRFESSSPDRGDGSKNGVPEPSDPWEKAHRGLEALAKPMR